MLEGDSGFSGRTHFRISRRCDSFSRSRNDAASRCSLATDCWCACPWVAVCQVWSRRSDSTAAEVDAAARRSRAAAAAVACTVAVAVVGPRSERAAFVHRPTHAMLFAARRMARIPWSLARPRATRALRPSARAWACIIKASCPPPPGAMTRPGDAPRGAPPGVRRVATVASLAWKFRSA